MVGGSYSLGPPGWGRAVRGEAPAAASAPFATSGPRGPSPRRSGRRLHGERRENARADLRTVAHRVKRRGGPFRERRRAAILPLPASAKAIAFAILGASRWPICRRQGAISGCGAPKSVRRAGSKVACGVRRTVSGGADGIFGPNAIALGVRPAGLIPCDRTGFHRSG